MKGSIGAITNLLRSYRDHSELKPLTLLRFGVLLALVVALF